MSMKTLGYYPGCSLEGTAVEYDRSSRACCEAVGIRLTEIPDWSCCGSSPAHAVDTVLSGALSARNLALAAENGCEAVATPCPNCLVNLRTAGRDIADEAKRERINELLSKPCTEAPEAKSLLQVLFEHAGPDEIAKRTVAPLAGLSVAPYYGCILNRPPDLMQFDDPENPTAMDELLAAAGAEVAPFALKTECCGASYGVPRRDLVMELSGRLLENAVEIGADCIAVACPLCQMNLDLRQSQIASARKQKFDIPVFYFTQLIGLALGVDPSRLGLEKLTVSPDRLLRKLGVAI